MLLPDPQPDSLVRLAPGVSVREGVLRWSFSRSGGPGGQNVNKVNTKAELRVALADVPMSEGARRRLAAALGKRLLESGGGGEAVIVSQSERSQQANKDECLERLRELVLRALTPPTPRRPTKPTRASKQRRLSAKRQRGEVKRRRGAAGEE